MEDRILEVIDQGRLGNSDHTMILVTVQTALRSSKTVEKVPNWSKADWSELRREARLKNWVRATRDLPATAAWNMVRDDLVNLVDTFVPKKMRRNHNRPPWMSQQILREIRRRKTLSERGCGRVTRTRKDMRNSQDWLNI